MDVATIRSTVPFLEAHVQRETALFGRLDMVCLQGPPKCCSYASIWLRIFLYFPPVGFKGNLSLLDIYIYTYTHFFPGVLSKWKYVGIVLLLITLMGGPILPCCFEEKPRENYRLPAMGSPIRHIPICNFFTGKQRLFGPGRLPQKVMVLREMKGGSAAFVFPHMHTGSLFWEVGTHGGPDVSI